jgi:hypothetical protein
MEPVLELVDGDVPVATVRIDGDVPGLFVVDAFARVAVAARLLGWTARLREPDDALRGLFDLCGLRLEDGRQPERREVLGAEEVVQPDEPPA